MIATMPPPAYILTGRPSLGAGIEYVTVRMPRGLRQVTVYVTSADGQDEMSGPARWDHKPGLWTARFRFSRSDESGTWYVDSTQALSWSGRWFQRTSPDPSFTVTI